MSGHSATASWPEAPCLLSYSPLSECLHSIVPWSVQAPAWVLQLETLQGAGSFRSSCFKTQFNTISRNRGHVWYHRDGGALALAPTGFESRGDHCGALNLSAWASVSPHSSRTPVLGTQRSQEVWQLGSRLPPLWPLHGQAASPSLAGSPPDPTLRRPPAGALGTLSPVVCLVLSSYILLRAELGSSAKGHWPHIILILFEGYQHGWCEWE